MPKKKGLEYLGSRYAVLLAQKLGWMLASCLKLSCTGSCMDLLQMGQGLWIVGLCHDFIWAVGYCDVSVELDGPCECV